MAAEVFLVISLVITTVEHQPICPGITDAVAERSVQSETGLVDEVSHVALDTAVVVNEKDHPLSVGHEHPAREVDRANAPETTAPSNIQGALRHSVKRVHWR